MSCDKIDLDRIAKIQDVGWLFIIKESVDIITHVSENVVDLDWVDLNSPREFIGKKVGEVVVDPTVSDALGNLLRNPSRSARTGLLTYNQSCTVITRDDGTTLLEIVPRGPTFSFFDSPNTVFSMETINQIEKATNMTEAGAAAITAIMTFVSYNRGMVYRFLEDLCGEIICEKIGKGGGEEPRYLGLRFPATDIPLPARKMYLDDRVRIISDIEEEPVLVVGDARTANLRYCHMRACADVHVEYLRNMNVRSTMSIAIVNKKKLWGLVAMHSDTREYPSIECRVMSELISRTLSLCAESFERETQRKNQITMNQMIHLSYRFSNMETFIRVDHDRILEAFKAQCILVREGERDPIGFNASKLSMNVRDMLNETAQRHDGSDIVTGHFTPENHQFFSILREDTHVVIVKFANKSRIKWAGNPREKKVVDGKLCPRNSFQAYEEHGLTHPTEYDTDMMTQFSYMMRAFFQRQMLTRFQTRVLDEPRQDKEFFAQMSHEIRTPFHGVYSAIEILLDEPDMPRDQRIQTLELAFSSAQTMLTTLNNILSVDQRPPGDENPVDPGTPSVSIGDVLLSIKSSLQLFAIREGVAFSTFTTVGHDEKFVIDLTRLSHITNNLINNAIKFTSAGGKVAVNIDMFETPSLVQEYLRHHCAEYEGSSMDEPHDWELRGEPDHHGGRWIVVVIADTGCGMKPDDLKNIFNPYVQVSTETHKHAGTGLGLSICTEEVKKMKGCVGFFSTAGRGTAAYVVIPTIILHGEGGCIISKSGDSPTRGENNQGCSVNRILRTWFIVDDSRINRRLLVHMVKKEHAVADIPNPVIVEIDNGKDAVRIFNDHVLDEKRVHVIIMDYHMAGMDGVSATTQIRNIESGKESSIPAVIYGCTADITQKVRARLLDAGMNGVWVKPIPKKALRNLVRSL
ncbi:putative hybrid sensor histdine kinase [Feldmannia species virus]|uniref:histidine kinase n=1 Tax=Feldmannia species virus TaxID=39420 RepID=B5LWN8_9PHYC|nr:putative hybrid sensor histdine kinase [Feldmannia species virus]ACH46901.1 putative hybrid sensor histdine kinase [Feldmannia species virus]